MPNVVARTEVPIPSRNEVLKARTMASFSNSFPNHCRLKPSIGKPPNWELLKASSSTTATGANMKT